MRSTGRTTRLVDFYVQKLFTNPNVAIDIRDHEGYNEANRYLVERIYNRFRNEFPQQFLFLEKLGNNRMMLRQ